MSGMNASLGDDYESSDDSLYMPSPEVETDSEETQLDDDDSTDDRYDVDSGPKLMITLEDVHDEVEQDDNSYHSEELRSPISTDEKDEGVKKVYPQFNEAAKFGNVYIELGMEFSSIASFKTVVIDYTIHLGREIKWVKNEKMRARARCKEPECNWEIFCSWSRVYKSFQVKTFRSEHGCGRKFRNKQATRKWVVKQLIDKVRTQPNVTYAEVYEYLKRDFAVDVDDSKIFRALKEARQIVEGSELEQYARIWDYAHELLRSNPGSKVKIKTIPIPEE